MLKHHGFQRRKMKIQEKKYKKIQENEKEI